MSWRDPRTVSTDGRGPTNKRGNLGVTPTELGRLVSAGAERVEERVRELEDTLLGAQSVSGKVRATLTEGFAMHFVVPYVFPEIERRHPDLEMHLLTTDRMLDLDKHEADLALSSARFSQSKGLWSA